MEWLNKSIWPWNNWIKLVLAFCHFSYQGIAKCSNLYFLAENEKVNVAVFLQSQHYKLVVDFIITIFKYSKFKLKIPYLIARCNNWWAVANKQTNDGILKLSPVQSNEASLTTQSYSCMVDHFCSYGSHHHLTNVTLVTSVTQSNTRWYKPGVTWIWSYTFPNFEI